MRQPRVKPRQPRGLHDMVGVFLDKRRPWITRTKINTDAMTSQIVIRPCMACEDTRPTSHKMT